MVVNATLNSWTPTEDHHVVLVVAIDKVALVLVHVVVGVLGPIARVRLVALENTAQLVNVDSIVWPTKGDLNVSQHLLERQRGARLALA